ncbi:hypothetical protein JQ581_08615 [Bradyrhizobium liaoningense]|uniref:hypothetical protein n=1 Tax=Bradyrhizobium TaxID=374 RepID=UPI001BA9DC5B|nr:MULTISPECIES: hypothetical protein [Bradyrhizobium]MBR0736989.1 hypothetical protein [Bradyrhizobium liaoningense]MBR1178034.1 hypothetical protein [Bradyrhizobium sp. KB893862 SZCCT0404]
MRDEAGPTKAELHALEPCLHPSDWPEREVDGAKTKAFRPDRAGVVIYLLPGDKHEDTVHADPCVTTEQTAAKAGA